MIDPAVRAQPRIVILGPSPRAPGGIGQFSRRLGAALSPRAQVGFISYARLYPTWTAAGRQAEIVAPVARAVAPDAAGRGTSRAIAWRPWTWRRARREIARAAPDLLVIQWWHPFFGPVTRSLARSARRAGARIVCVCHNARPHERFPLTRWLTMRALADVHFVVAMSTTVADEIHELVPRVDIAILEHPPNLDLQRSADLPGAPQPGQRSILFFGTVRAYKGLEDLLEALPAVLEEMPAVRLTVAGEFFGSEARYRAIVGGLGLGSVVDLLPGYVPDEQVGPLFGSTDLLVLPYRSASQSGIVALAALAGTPVVATSVGGLPDMIGRNGVLVPPRDPAALAIGIVRALRAPPSPPARPTADWDAWGDAVLGALEVSPRAVRL